MKPVPPSNTQLKTILASIDEFQTLVWGFLSGVQSIQSVEAFYKGHASLGHNIPTFLALYARSMHDALDRQVFFHNIAALLGSKILKKSVARYFAVHPAEATEEHIGCIKGMAAAAPESFIQLLKLAKSREKSRYDWYNKPHIELLKYISSELPECDRLAIANACPGRDMEFLFEVTGWSEIKGRLIHSKKGRVVLESELAL